MQIFHECIDILVGFVIGDVRHVEVLRADQDRAFIWVRTTKREINPDFFLC